MPALNQAATASSSQNLVSSTGKFCSGCPVACPLIQDLTEVATLEDIYCPSQGCDEPFSVREFFTDAPWLRIPKDRHGEILIEPLYPRGRLLGGSPSQKPVSKIAALTAARKKKENEGTKVIPPRSVTTSVALLDKLSGRTSSPTSTHLALSVSKSNHSESVGEDQGEKIQASVRPSQNDGLQTSDSKPVMHRHMRVLRQSSSSYSSSSPLPIHVPIAPPSKFAEVLFGDSVLRQERPHGVPFQPYYIVQLGPTLTNFESFAGPSPDDTVLKAQNSKGHLFCVINMRLMADIA